MAAMWMALGALVLAQAGTPEARVIEYLKTHVQPGQRVVVSELSGKVFTTPEEKKALDRLFNLFFKLPPFIAQHQQQKGKPPTLAELGEQFALESPGAADVLLRVLEADPRLPRFLARDPKTGEILKVDALAIQAHPAFAKQVERSLSGLEGRAAPAFTASAYAGGELHSATLLGQPHVVYFWFTNCPPCVKTAPQLVALARTYAQRGLKLVAANADRVLDLDVSDAERAAYAPKLAGLTLVHATAEMQSAYAGVSVYPSLFFVDKRGTVVRQLVGPHDPEELQAAIELALK
jgi:thiol-disulfide isomerase/thioredoxin